MSARSHIIDARHAARVGSMADNASDTGGALTLITWMAGIGFVTYAMLNWVLPSFFDAATKTRHSVRGFRNSKPHASSHAGFRFTSSPAVSDCAASPYAAGCSGISG